MEVYQMCIANIANYIKSWENVKPTGENIDAFEASIGIAIAFCKTKEQVVMDIVNYKN